MEAQEELAYIEKYLNQQLTGDELLRFNQWRQEDPVAEKKIREFQYLIIGIQEQKLEQELITLRPLLKTQKKSANKPWLAAAAILAMVFLGLGIWWYNQSQTDQDLYAQYYKPDPGLVTLMDISSKTAFEEGMLAYKTGNYTEAIQTWKALWNKNPTNDSLNYFLGSAYMADQQYTQATPYFKPVLADSSSSFYQDAIWYQSLLFIEQGNFVEAKQLLEISDRPKAKPLLSIIQEKYENP